MTKSDDDFDPGANRYFDRDGQPMRLLDWGRAFESLEHRMLYETFLRKEPPLIAVATVWNGFDPYWQTPESTSEPRIYASIIRKPEGGIIEVHLFGVSQDTLVMHEKALAHARNLYRDYLE